MKFRDLVALGCAGFVSGYLGLAVSSSASADTLSFDAFFEDNALGDLHFRSPRGESFFRFGLETNLRETELTTQNGIDVGETSRTLWQASIDLTHGLTDWLEIGVRESYLLGLGQGFTDPRYPYTTRSSARGPASPIFTVDIRYWGGLNQPSFGSLALSAQPALGSRQVPAPSRSGNNLTSGARYTLALEHVWVYGAHEFGLTPAAHYQAASMAADVDGQLTANLNRHWNYDLSAIYRLHLNNYVFVQGEAVVHEAGRVDGVYPERVPRATFVVQEPFYFLPSLTLGWRVQGDWLLTATYTRQKFSQYTRPTAWAPLANQGTTLIRDSLGLAVAFIF